MAGIGLDESDLGESFTTVLSKKLRIEVSTTPVALTASYQAVYSYTGAGKITGFAFAFSKAGTSTKLTIDGVEIIYDIANPDIAAVQSDKIVNGIPLVYDTAKDVLVFSSVQPIEYDSSVLIEALKTGGPAVNMTGYMISITKEA